MYRFNDCFKNDFNIKLWILMAGDRPAECGDQQQTPSGEVVQEKEGILRREFVQHRMRRVGRPARRVGRR